uniref:RNase H type-1 domain-containing protein n=1 Tax=viral metagenome TaxID=1070528 RepID=A0A6C0KP45_9ZZZZ
MLLKKNQQKIYPICEYVLNFNGYINSSKLNSIGLVLYKNNEEVWGQSRYIGSNLLFEEIYYHALIIGLEHAIDDNIKILSVCCDNIIIIKQINNLLKVDSKLLLLLLEKINDLKKSFKYIDFNYINDTKRANELSKIALEK